jgi:hypothetical protein
VEQLPPQSNQDPHPSHTPTNAPGPSKKPWYKRWWVIAVVAVVVIGGFASALNGSGDNATATSSGTSATSAPERDDESTEPSEDTEPSIAASDASSTPPTPKPSPTTSSAAPTPSPTPTPTPTEEPDVPADPADYEKLGTRDLALITKNPDSHLGRQVQVYANITQFDAATGDCIFRGDTAYTNMADSWDYEHNSMFMAEGGVGCEALGDFVADDQVLVMATVGPSYSYDTQIGGSTTVPTYIVDGIDLVQ